MTMLTGVPDADVLRGRWKWFVGFGVVFVILGVIALMNAVDATLITTVIIGLLMMIAGVAQLVGAFSGGRSVGGRLLAILLGILYLVVGYEVVADPIQGAIALTVVIALLMIIGGVIRIVAAVAERDDQWVLYVVIGVINLLLGLWLWSGIPVTGIAIGIFVGLDLMLAGVTWIVAGWGARSLPVSRPATA